MQKKVAKPKRAKSPEIEELPDAWERFERAVDVVMKSGPIHRTAKELIASERHVRKGKRCD